MCRLILSHFSIFIALQSLGQITIVPTQPIFLLSEIVEDTNLTFLVTNGHDVPKSVLLLKHAQCEPDEWVDQFCDEGFCYTTSINEIEIQLEANESREYGITIAMNDVIDLAHYKVKATDLDNIDDFQFADIYVNTFDCLTTNMHSPSPKQSLPYPNPTSDFLHVDDQVVSGSVYNAVGRKCEVVFDQQIFDLSPLPVGRYYVQLVREDGVSSVYVISKD